MVAMVAGMSSGGPWRTKAMPMGIEATAGLSPPQEFAEKPRRLPQWHRSPTTE